MSDSPRDAMQVDSETKLIVWRLETALKDARKHGVKATRDMHKVVLEDVRRAERRARAAEKRARQAERRAVAAERELAAVRSSTTWKAGRVVVGVPARIKAARTRIGRKS